MEVEIEIDAITDCLVRAGTGERLDTEYRLVAQTITPGDAAALMREGWKFDWSIPHSRGYEIYELLLKGDEEVQGMVALRHVRDQLYTHVDIVEAAPHNVGSGGRYRGVGAHLFAIACMKSWGAGNEGYVQFTAKSGLAAYYREALGAISIDAQVMYIDSYGALELIRRYFEGSGQ